MEKIENSKIQKKGRLSRFEEQKKWGFGKTKRTVECRP
jgi:hypothetical protein